MFLPLWPLLLMILCWLHLNIYGCLDDVSLFAVVSRPNGQRRHAGLCRCGMPKRGTGLFCHDLGGICWGVSSNRREDTKDYHVQEWIAFLSVWHCLFVSMTLLEPTYLRCLNTFVSAAWHLQFEVAFCVWIGHSYASCFACSWMMHHKTSWSWLLHIDDGQSMIIIDSCHLSTTIIVSIITHQCTAVAHQMVMSDHCMSIIKGTLIIAIHEPWYINISAVNHHTTTMKPASTPYNHQLNNSHPLPAINPYNHPLPSGSP